MVFKPFIYTIWMKYMKTWKYSCFIHIFKIFQINKFIFILLFIYIINYVSRNQFILSSSIPFEFKDSSSWYELSEEILNSSSWFESLLFKLLLFSLLLLLLYILFLLLLVISLWLLLIWLISFEVLLILHYFIGLMWVFL